MVVVLEVLGLAVAAVLAYLAVTFVQVWMSSHRDDPRPADAIVVLGAAQYNGRPSPVLQARLDHAIALYRNGVAPLVVVTGGRQSGDRVTEAKASADYLIARGVPDSAIRREVQGADTWESLAASARFLDRDGAENVVLVSDPYHNHRVAAIATEAGLNPVGVSPQAEVVPEGSDAAVALARETLGVGLGRVIGFRRLASYAS